MYFRRILASSIFKHSTLGSRTKRSNSSQITMCIVTRNRFPIFLENLLHASVFVFLFFFEIFTRFRVLCSSSSFLPKATRRARIFKRPNYLSHRTFPVIGTMHREVRAKDDTGIPARELASLSQPLQRASNLPRSSRVQYLKQAA